MKTPQNRKLEGRKSDGTFAKGVSGNPGGRPKSLREVEALAATHTVDAIETLHRIMMEDLRATESGAIIPMAQIRAAELLLERAWGAPRKNVDLTSGGEKLQLVNPEATVTELRRYADEIEANEKFSEGKESILQ